ncbi:hypothetical protein QT397_11830 [Microbulbifer sp. MKSA007]|uniref:hypothetical protein n=1 Tax=Microbulbifer sp. ANSA005 TaxID=3243362 RepID=UPI002B2EC5E4|nr:hypothetical protein QT397_11830 [Microbulbifer sp. MKSA007]
MENYKIFRRSVLAAAVATILAGCSDDNDNDGSVVEIPDPEVPEEVSLFESTLESEGSQHIGPSTAQQPHVLAVAENVKIVNLLSNGYLPTDYIDAETPQSDLLPIFEEHSSLDSTDTDGLYVLSGEPDGLGYLDNDDGTFTLFMNQEHYNFVGGDGVVLENSNRSLKSTGTFVSKWVIDKTTGEIEGGEDLIKGVYAWRRTLYDTDGEIAEEPGYTYVTQMKPYFDADGDLVNTGAFERFCSATLPAETAFYNAETGKGTQVRLFLTGEESDGGESLKTYYDGLVQKRGYEGLTFDAFGSISGEAKEKSEIESVYEYDKSEIYIGRGIAVLTTGDNAGDAYELPLLGKARFENIVPNYKAQDKTVLLSIDDERPRFDSPDNAYRHGGYITVYVGDKTNEGSEVDKAGLTNGDLYAVRVLDSEGAPIVDFDDDDNRALLDESALSFELVQLTDQDTNGDGTPEDIRDMSQEAFRTHTTGMDASLWRSPEDGDWDPIDPNVFYFGAKYGVYQLDFADITNPAEGGLIKRVVKAKEDGDITTNYYNFDNMAAVAGVDDKTRLVLQFDNSSLYSPIYVADPETGEMTRIAEFNPEIIGDSRDELDLKIEHQLASGELDEEPTDEEYDTMLIEHIASKPYRQYYAKSSDVRSGLDSLGVEVSRDADAEASGIIYAGDILGEGWFLSSMQFHYDFEGRVDSYLGSLDVRDQENGPTTQLIQEMMAGGQLHAIYIPQAVGLVK